MNLAFNKWDTLDEDHRYMLEREIERPGTRAVGSSRGYFGEPAGTRISWCPFLGTWGCSGIRVFRPVA